MVDLPAELKPMAAEGPTRYTVEGNRITFDGMAQLPPKAETIYRDSREGLEARRSPRPLPTVERRHAEAGDEGREHAGLCGRVVVQSLTRSCAHSAVRPIRADGECQGVWLVLQCRNDLFKLFVGAKIEVDEEESFGPSVRQAPPPLPAKHSCRTV